MVFVCIYTATKNANEEHEAVVFIVVSQSRTCASDLTCRVSSKSRAARCEPKSKLLKVGVCRGLCRGVS